MNKIYISYWTKGFTNKTYPNQLDMKFLEYSIRNVKKHSPNLTLIVLCDSELLAKINPELLNLAEFRNTLDEYNIYDDFKWPYVKMKAIDAIPDEEVLHLDFDIIWKYDITNVINYVKENNIDALFQSYEMLNSKHHYYLDFLKNNSYIRDIVSSKKIENKMSYNCGIIYLNKNAKIKYGELLRERYVNDMDRKQLTALEQLVIPNMLIYNDFRVEILANIWKKLPLNFKTLTYKEFDKFDYGTFNTFCNVGAFLHLIRYYHFLGTIKENYNLLEVIEEFQNHE